MPAARERLERYGQRRADFLAVGPFDFRAHAASYLLFLAWVQKARAAVSVASLRREEVDARSASGEGIGYIDRREPPHPTPLPCGEREQAEFVATLRPITTAVAHTTKYPSWIART